MSARETQSPVRLLRDDAGITRTELAQRAGVACETIAGVERGERMVGGHAFAIARALGVPTTALRSMRAARDHLRARHAMTHPGSDRELCACGHTRARHAGSASDTRCLVVEDRRDLIEIFDDGRRSTDAHCGCARFRGQGER